MIAHKEFSNNHAMKTLYFFLFLFLLGCASQKELAFTEEDANYKNGTDSEVRSLRFRYLGEGNRVEFNFRDPVSGGGLTIDENSLILQCKNFGRWSGNRLTFDQPTFPFQFYIRYKILVQSGTSLESRHCEFDLTINKPGSWRVEVNH